MFLSLKNKNIIILRVLKVSKHARTALKPFVVSLVAMRPVVKIGCAKPATKGLMLTIGV
jgi:hypothetical protein